MLSFWEQNSFLEYDFIVVGGGIVGLSTAIEIKEQNPTATIAILEKGFFPSGASTKNAGFACFGSLTELLSDLETLSETEVANLVELRWLGLEKLRSRLGDNNIGYLPNGGYELLNTSQTKYLEKMESVNQLIKPLFKSDVFSIQNQKIAEFGFNPDFVESLVLNQFEAQIDTGLMMKSLIAYTSKLGISIYNSAAVLEIEDDGNRVTVNVSQEGEILHFRAGKVAICTNAFTKKLLPNLDLKPGRGQVLITKPIEKLPFKGVFHYDEGFYYFRNYGKRVIFGGGRNLDFEGEQTTEFQTTELIQTDLDKKLSEVILPNQAYEIEHRWAGIMGFGENKKPILESVSENVFLGVRLGGMGVAIGSQVGKGLADLVLG
ncbi:MAG: glycine/D-amino acid oxidase-like deaminating enzyme [Arenicella sp.]|jgi:glycine/D-amino acid oxidase-like deaminating enzyme